LIRLHEAAGLILIGLLAGGCQKKPAPAAGAGMRAMPVQTVAVKLAPVAQSSDYVATIKSRRSATLQPQVSGPLIQIGAHSGDLVEVGQVLMQIDGRQQQAEVASLRATERQKLALYNYDTIEFGRQRKLFEAGVTSRDTFDQAQQAYQNAKADYQSAVEARKTQQQMLGYYTVRAPFSGVVGDIPVHVGDYVTTSTVLTTVDENKDLEAYIYVPTERSSQLRMGLEVDLMDNSGKLLEKTRIDFISPQVDSTLQGILVKAPVRSSPEMLRNAQMVSARIVWSTEPMAVVPVLAVTREGAQSFVFVARQKGGRFFAEEVPVTLGNTVGNAYSIPSGLSAGDRVIVSGTQFLVNNMPVLPMGG
jgi:RND family efflux transporter MFP subunit